MHVGGCDRGVAECDSNLIDFVDHIASGIQAWHDRALMRIHDKISKLVACRPEI